MKSGDYNKLPLAWWSFVFTVVLTSFSTHAQSGPTNLNVTGALYLPSGSPVTQSGVNFRLEIWDKDSTCLLYTEQHLNEDLSQTKGGFSLAVGKGTSAQNYIDGNSVLSSKVFENYGAQASVGPSCPAGANFASGDERVIRVSYDLGGGFIAMSPDVPIASSAYAMVAETLQGKRPSDFVQLRDDGTHDLNQANVENVFSSTNYARLQELLVPTAPIPFSGVRLTGIADPSAAQDAATKNYTDTKLAGQTIDLVDVAPGFGGGKVLTWDQAANKWVAMAQNISGTAGGDLTGTYPNPSIANLAIGTSKIQDNAISSAKIQTTGLAANRLLITDATTGATVTYKTCGSDEILKFTTGVGWECASIATYSAVTSVNTKTGAVVLTGADLGLGSASMRNIGIGASNVPDLDGGGKLAASTIPNFSGDITGAYTNAFVARLQGQPISATAPNTNEVLRWNGSRWEPTLLTDNVGITALNGDITAAGTGLVSATIVNNAITTPKVFATPGANRLVATDGTSGATLVPFVCNLDETMKWTASGWGCTTVGNLLGNQFIVDGGNARGAAISIGTSDNYDLRLITNGQARISIGNTGNVGIGTTAPSHDLALGGDIARTIGMERSSGGVGHYLTISAGGAMLASTDQAGGDLFLRSGVSTGSGASGIFLQTVTAGSSGTNTNSATTKMTISSAGNVGIGTTTPNRLLHVVGPVRINPTALPSSPAAGDLAFDSGASNTLKFHNGTSWQTVGTSSSTGDINNGGNAFGTPITIGSNDNQDLRFKTNATDRLYIGNTGNVGIGTTTPSYALSLDGDLSRIIGMERSSSGAGNYLTITAGGAKLATTDQAGGDLFLRSGISTGSGGSGIFLQTVTPGSSGTISNLATTKMTISSSGNVGIGVSVPTRLLQVAGAMKLNATTAPSSPTAGDIFVDSSASNALKYHNGTSWVALGSGTGDFLANGSVSMAGQFKSIAGSAGAPGISFTGDLDNGIFAPAADNVAMATSGIERMRVLANGNVGIGNTSPAYALDVTGSIHATSKIWGFQYNAVSSGSYAPLVSYNFGAAANSKYWDFLHQDNGTLSLRALDDSYVASNNALVISRSGTSISSVSLPNGNVGIGTTSPNRLLEVTGPIRVAPAALPGTPGAGDIAIDSGGSNSLKYYNGSAWVSVGSGTGDFLASGTVPMTGQFRSIAGTASAPGMSFTGDLDNGIFAPAADNVAITTSGSEKMRLTASGYVGIGTTAPARLLEVAGPMRITPTTLPSSPAAGDLAIDSGASNALKFYNGTSWQTVGTGSGAGDFMKDGSVAMTGNIRLNNNWLSGDGGNEGVFVDSAGKVGIGTNSPTDNFHVNFSTTITGGLTVGPISSSDNAILGNGSAAFPSHSFLYSMGMGMYAPAINNLGFSTSGTERIRVMSTGEVGIGTSSPNSILDINGSLTLRGSTSGYSVLKSPAAAGNVTWTLPAADGTNGQILSTNGAGQLGWTNASGSGTVTSVNLSMPGIFSVSGGPLTTSGTLAVTASGTSGGIPYFSSATALASSAALTQNGIVLGGGAGAAPTSLSVGASGTLLTGTAAAPAFSATPTLGVAGTTKGTLSLTGNTSGTITIQPQAAAGSYNFNLPTAAGTSGQPLLSGGGGTTAMTFGTLSVAAGGTGLTSGTQGGIPYFSGSTTMASSAALTQYQVVLGGGTGAPTVVSGTGTSGQVLTSNGTGAAPTWQAAATGASPAGSGSEIQFRSNATTFGANSTFVWDNTNVRLGVGTASPTSPLHVYKNSTATSGTTFGNRTQYEIAPSATSTADNRANFVSAYFYGSNSSNAVSGTSVEAYNDSTATLSYMTGLNLYTAHTNSGTTSSMMAMNGSVDNSSTAGTITTATAGYFSVLKSGSGSIGTGYGVYVGSVAGTSKWSIYSSDSTAPSYFAGNVGIGVPSPTNKLEVSGSVKIVDGNQASGKVLTSDASGVASWQTPTATSSATMQSFTASGTWTKPSTGSIAEIECWGAGGGGARHSSLPSGGGGGGYTMKRVLLSTLGATETVTIGTGGAGSSTNAAGGQGGDSSFGSVITAYGGAGGPTSGYGGGGGGPLGAGSGYSAGAPSIGQGTGGEGSTPTNCTGGVYHGGGGGTYAMAGCGSIHGGGGGGGAPNAGSTVYAGGTSLNGGAGGASSATGTAGNGTVPGGGGGGSRTGTSGAGANGMCRITIW